MLPDTAWPIEGEPWTPGAWMVLDPVPLVVATAQAAWTPTATRGGEGWSYRSTSCWLLLLCWPGAAGQAEWELLITDTRGQSRLTVRGPHIQVLRMAIHAQGAPLPAPLAAP